MKYVMIALSVIVTLSSNFFLFSQEQTTEISQEDNLKAVFIYNFLQYVEWPNAADDTNVTENFIIDIYGDHSLVTPMVEIAEKKTVGDRKIMVSRRDNIEEIGDSHILFIASTKKNQLEQIMKLLESKPVLTIGDTDGFAKQGVAINFVVVNDKLKFEMNLQTIMDAGLMVSSHLLRLAILINE